MWGVVWLGPIPPQLAAAAAESARDLFRRCVSVDWWVVQVVCEGPITPQLAAAAAPLRGSGAQRQRLFCPYLPPSADSPRVPLAPT